MTASTAQLAERVAALRSEFDRTFAAPRRIDTAIKHDLLAIRVGAEPFALRLAEVAGLFASRQITRVPGGDAALLGMAGFRGAVVPVYALGALLSFPSSRQAPRWLVVTAAAPVALAFDAFEGHLRAAAADILPRQSQGSLEDFSLQDFAPDVIRAGDAVRPIIHLRSAIAMLGKAAAPSIVVQE